MPSDTSQKNGETFMSSVAASGDRRFMGDDFSALGFDFPDVDGLGKLRYDEERYGMRQCFCGMMQSEAAKLLT